MLQGVPGLWRRNAAVLAILAVSSPAWSLAQGRQWHALPVAGGTDAVASAARLETGLPAWRVLYEAARRRHGLWGEAAGGGAGEVAGEPGGAAVVPLPLAPRTWRGLLRRESLPDDQLAVAIVADRRSALLYRGLAALDEATLAALAADPAAVRRLHERHADVLAVFGARFRVREGVVVVPGGEEEEPVWGRLVGHSPRVPLAFLMALLAANGGRQALLYDSVARLDPPRQRFALGLYRPAGPARVGSLLSLAGVFDREAAWWHPEDGAFKRPEADTARLLQGVRVGSDGSLAPPAARAFWEAVFEEGQAAPRAEGAAGGREDWAARVRASEPAEAAWLAERVGAGAPSARRRRLEQLFFAQRVFGEAGEEALPDVLAAVRGLPEARSLLLALERMGSRDPGLFAAAVGAARRAGAASGREEALRAHGGLQGALGVVDRARFARTLELAAAERLVRSLCGLPGEGAERARALAAWVEGVLLPELGRAVYGAHPLGEPETTILRAMAGDRVDGREELAPFDWEGLWYRADPGRADFARLERVRSRQGGGGLSEALSVCRAEAAKRPDPCAAALGEALVSLVYAAAIGEPDGPALAGSDPSLRHDFGAEPWALPEEVVGPGEPRHVRGSLLGLERALARLSLHGLAGDALPVAPPVIDAVQRRSLAVSAVLSNPRDLTDADRDAISAAIESGRARVAALRAGDAEAAASEAGLDPWRARAFEWLLEHRPDDRGSFFSLGELLNLGAPGERLFDAWGVSDDLAAGLVPRLPGPVPLDEASGRLPPPALAASFVDLGIRVAVHLSERRLPASLYPWLVSTLLPDLFAEARPVAADDRLGLDAWVRAQGRERLDDSVASLVGRGPLQPASGPGGAR